MDDDDKRSSLIIFSLIRSKNYSKTRTPVMSQRKEKNRVDRKKGFSKKLSRIA